MAQRRPIYERIVLSHRERGRGGGYIPMLERSRVPRIQGCKGSRGGWGNGEGGQWAFADAGRRGIAEEGRMGNEEVVRTGGDV